MTATERSDVPNQTRLVIDGAGRTTAAIFQPYDEERWRTTTAYGGDRIDTTPPLGGTASSALTDAKGRTTALRQYFGLTPTPNTAGTWDQTTYTHNAKGQLERVTDAVGNKWEYSYDLLGRQTQMIDPDKGTTKSGYNNAGQLTSTDLNGKKLFYTLDALGRKKTLRENTLTGTVRAEWTYDSVAKGYLASSKRKVGSDSYITRVQEYSDSYQPKLTEIEIPATETGLGGIYVYANAYNPSDSSLASMSIPSASTGGLPGETLSFSYNNLGMPMSMSSLYGTSPAVNMSLVQAAVYTALGQTARLTFDTNSVDGGRVWQTYTRELDTGRVNRIRTDREDAAPYLVADLRYSYDDAGNITKISDMAADPVDDTQCFAHDYLQRLVEAWTPASGDCAAAKSTGALGGPAPYWHSWELDKTGNRTKLTVHTATMNYVTDYQYPAPGTTRAHAVNSSTGAQTAEYRYDANGNTTCRPAGTGTNDCDPTNPVAAGSQVLSWDPEGHLATSTDASGTTTYIYDADGNRLIRRDPTGRTLYLPGQEIRYTIATGAVTCTRYYVFNGITVASRDATGLTWLGTDHQGTAYASIRNSDQQVALRRQLPYGGSRGTAPTWPNNQGFVGGTKDNTGLLHLGAREYDPGIGRFISVDPIMDLTDPQQWNAYAYSNNRPITLSDPTGLCPTGSMCDIYGTYYTENYGSGSPGSGGGSGNGNGGGGGNNGSPQGPPVDTVVKEPLTKDQAAMLLFGRTWGLTGNDNVTAHMATLCVNENNQEACQFLVDKPGLFTILFDELTGLADYKRCMEEGDKGSCAMFLAGVIPWGKIAKGGKLVSLLAHGDDVVDAARDTSKLDELLSACMRSFSADTPVLLADGTAKPISEIEVGDKVLATDPETGEQGPHVVTHVWVHDDVLIDLVLQGGLVVTTTEDHPFWNATDREWQEIQNVDPGDKVRNPAGRTLEVQGLNWNTRQYGAAYNLTVANIHTYYVLAGDTPVLVHNTNCITMSSAIGNDSLLTKAAQQAGRNQRVQQEMDGLFAQLSQGNMNPGIGTKSLGGTDVLYARGANGARLFFRNVDGGIQIVGKADKGNESTVINRLLELYGR